MSLKIDLDACNGCGSCEAACNFGGIIIVNDKAKVTEDCRLCGACVDDCPVNAITIEKIMPSGIKQDFSEYRGVWVIGEHHDAVIEDVVYQLLGKGQELAKKLKVSLTAVILGLNITKQELENLGNYGADHVLYVDSPLLKEYSSELYVEIITNLIKERKPEIVLIGSTAGGRDFAPRVSKRINTGLTADCTGLEVELESRNLLQTRPTFGGNIMAVIKTPDSRPQMATVRQNTFKPRIKEKASYELTRLSYDATDSTLSVKLIKTIKVKRKHRDIQQADVIVAGGRGVGCKEDFKLIEDLARELDGDVAGSRMSCELDWVDRECQVGLTGKIVAPKLYFACGISGAIQHKIGMKNSEFIIAINTDPNAPIFEIAHVNVVADLKKFIPALIKEIKKIKNQK
ncbi:MAG: FAD-binding protein [Promethearchaeota archaeon]